MAQFGVNAAQTEVQDQSEQNKSDLEKEAQDQKVSTGICPRPDFAPERLSMDHDDPKEVEFVDHNQEVKNVGTDIVVQNFFESQENIYNFLKFVYQTIENALADYRKERQLEDRAIFLLFKGGIVLRMVANEVFDQLGPEARAFLQKEYAPFFKRSDADFSVYVDEKKLLDLDYDIVYREINELVFAQLNKIRTEFSLQPEKYFNFFRLNSESSQRALSKFFVNLNKLESLSKETNPDWYKAKFLQLQFRDAQAEPGAMCFYRGQYDFRYEIKDNKLVSTRISEEPHWIFNSDNRTLQWNWGSDPSKTVKFSLVRSKVAFEYTIEQDGKFKRRPIGGELIDVSIPHRKDDRLREFLDNYDETVAEYNIIADQLDDKFTLKAYSFSNLVEDLQFIILDSFDRPWDGRPKYTKRVKRLFFLFNVELLTAYGSSGVARDYLENVKERVLEPIAQLFQQSNDEEKTKVIKQTQYNIGLLSGAWAKMKLTNHFWDAFGKFAERMVKNPQPGDEEGFNELLNEMENNIDLSKELVKFRYQKVNQDEVYNVETKNLF